MMFCRTVRNARSLSEKLAQIGIANVVYYGDLEEEHKAAALQKWFRNSPPIICCTSALELGVHKGDVQLVIQETLAYSLSQYVQQIGRAGRDISRTTAVLFYNQLTEGYYKSVLQEMDEGDVKEMMTRQHQAMTDFCVNAQGFCRQRFFDTHFLNGNNATKPQEKCDEMKCDVCASHGMPVLVHIRTLMRPLSLLREISGTISFLEFVEILKSDAALKFISTADLIRLVLHQINVGGAGEELVKFKIGKNYDQVVRMMHKVKHFSSE